MRGAPLNSGDVAPNCAYCNCPAPATFSSRPRSTAPGVIAVIGVALLGWKFLASSSICSAGSEVCNNARFCATSTPSTSIAPGTPSARVTSPPRPRSKMLWTGSASPLCNGKIFASGVSTRCSPMKTPVPTGRCLPVPSCCSIPTILPPICCNTAIRCCISAIASGRATPCRIASNCCCNCATLICGPASRAPCCRSSSIGRICCKL